MQYKVSVSLFEMMYLLSFVHSLGHETALLLVYCCCCCYCCVDVVVAAAAMGCYSTNAD